jgi:hypothetical protein
VSRHGRESAFPCASSSVTRDDVTVALGGKAAWVAAEKPSGLLTYVALRRPPVNPGLTKDSRMSMNRSDERRSLSGASALCRERCSEPPVSPEHPYRWTARVSPPARRDVAHSVAHDLRRAPTLRTESPVFRGLPVCGPAWIRTRDQRIMSPLLYR